jgi:WW domain-containing oxidoreductase
MDTIKKAIGSAFDPNTDIPDLSGKVSISFTIHIHC